MSARYASLGFGFPSSASSSSSPPAAPSSPAAAPSPLLAAGAVTVPLVAIRWTPLELGVVRRAGAPQIVQLAAVTWFVHFFPRRALEDATPPAHERGELHNLQLDDLAAVHREHLLEDRVHGSCPGRRVRKLLERQPRERLGVRGLE